MNTQYLLDNLLQTLTEEQRNRLDRTTKNIVGRGYPKDQALAMSLAHLYEDTREPGGHHVINTLDGWAVCDESKSKPSAVFDGYDAALHRACEIGAETRSVVYVHGLEGTVHDRYDYRFATANDGALHVRPGESGWLVELRGDKPSVEAFSTKREALTHARPKAETMGVTLVTHYADGKVQSTRNHEGS